MEQQAFDELLANCKADPAMTILNLRNEGLRPYQAKILINVLSQHNPNLTHLDLSLNDIGDEGADAVAALIANSGSLIDIDLTANNISDSGAIALANAGMQRKIKLNLDHNQITENGEKALFAAKKENPRFIIRLFNNKFERTYQDIMKLMEDPDATAEICELPQPKRLSKLRQKFMALFPAKKHDYEAPVLTSYTYSEFYSRQIELQERKDEEFLHPQKRYPTFFNKAPTAIPAGIVAGAIAGAIIAACTLAIAASFLPPLAVLLTLSTLSLYLTMGAAIGSVIGASIALGNVYLPSKEHHDFSPGGLY